MNPDVIKAFLIQIGFQVKKGEQTAAVGAISAVGKAAFGVTAALAALATAATTAALAVASSFDKLYFVSQRTNTSVQNIRALSYAFGQVGGSSEQAVGSIESFQRAMRTNPGVGAFVRSLGVATEAGGKARDNLEVLMDSVDAIQKRTQGQQFAGAQLASILGLDEQTYDMMLRFRKEVKANQETYNQWSKVFGVDAKAASETSNELMHNLRELSTIASLAAQRLLLELVPGITSIVKSIRDWLAAHPELLEKIFRAIGDAASWIGEKVKSAYDTLAPFLSYLADQASAMWEDGSFLRAWEKIAGAFERVVTAIKNVLKWLNDLDRATDMSSGLNAIKSFLGWVDRKTSGAVQEGLGTLGSLDRATDTGVGVGRRSGGGSDGVDPGDKTGGRSATRRGDNVAGARESYNFWRSKGYTPAQAAGLVAMEEGESNFNPRAVGDGGKAHGAFQHHPDRRAKILRGAGIDIDKATHLQQLEAAHWEMTHGDEKAAAAAVRRATTPGASASAGVYNFERPLDKAGEAYRRGLRANYWARKFAEDGASVTLPQQTVTTPKTPPLRMTPGGFDFNMLKGSPAGTQAPSTSTSNTVQQNNPVSVQVNGASDPAATGQAVENAVNRANERSLRNAQTAIR